MWRKYTKMSIHDNSENTSMEELISSKQKVTFACNLILIPFKPPQVVLFPQNFLQKSIS